MKFKRKKNKPEIPAGTQCKFCPITIFKHNEAGGEIHFIDKKPACARCRILKGSKFAKQMKKDKKIYLKNKKAKEKAMQKEADENVERYALKKQIETGTSRLPIKK